MIRAGDRVAKVLERDERLVHVFAAASPHFQRLRNPGMRRVMARLVTVEQAARVAGLDVADLLESLNAALETAHEGGEIPFGRSEMNDLKDREPVPAELASRDVVDLDVREDLRDGREPFSRIMAAKQALPDGAVLRLRAIFEPAPLYQVMGKQGFAHWTERLADDDWRVWFYRAEQEPDSGRDGPAPMIDESREDVVVLDVRGLEPPEPMVRTLAALESLPEGAALVQVNARVPQFLLPRLEESGFRYEVREQGEELVRVFIRRRETR